MSDALTRKLQAISVRTEISSGNVAPLLHEIRHALARLVQSGALGVIDLKGIPLAPGEQDRIIQLLGEGEVRAELHVLGKSEVRETSFPGVWIVTHYDELEDIKARFVEITHLPEILRSQQADIEEGLRRLEAVLPTL